MYNVYIIIVVCHLVTSATAKQNFLHWQLLFILHLLVSFCHSSCIIMPYLQHAARLSAELKHSGDDGR